MAKRWCRALLVSVPVLAMTSIGSGLLQPYVQADLPGIAQAQQQQPDQRETRRTPALSNAVYEKLSAVQTLVDEKKYQEAINTLNGMTGGRNAPNSYELANIYNMYAFIYYSQENYAKALEYYRKVIEQPDIPVAMEDGTRYTIAQLYFVQEKWREGIQMLQEWVKTQEKVNADVYVLFAQGYYQLEQYDNALTNAEKAVAMVRAEGKQPREQWLGLLRYLYWEKKQYDKAIEILEELATHFSKRDYWLQLSQMYGEAQQERKQLAAIDAVYVSGEMEREQEIVTLAYLWLAQEVPYKAGKILEQGIKEKKVEPTARNLELLANAWRAAQETDKAIPAMEQAAQKSDKGELWAALGNIYLDKEENKKAIDAVRAGLQKGGLRRPDNAWLVLGMAYFNLQQFDEARRAFNNAAKDNRSSSYAKQWLEFIDKEEERIKSLQS
ncbi:MAG: tetratricopeptide repeat protein [Spongiibacteraceae bacterium]|nr:tetratricopeptide repeat protein [Spongiibacteraceae bacterium]